MKFGEPIVVEIDGQRWRRLEVLGTEDELDEVASVEAPKKGWTIEHRIPGVLRLAKPAVEPATSDETPKSSAPGGEAPKATPARSEADDEADALEAWEHLAEAVVVPEGKVACVRCRNVDRKDQLGGFVKCKAPGALSSAMARATWMSPTYPRECADFIARRPLSTQRESKQTQ